jgi:hypothetical protein
VRYRVPTQPEYQSCGVSVDGTLHCVCEDDTGNACRCGTPGEVFENPCEGGAEL